MKNYALQLVASTLVFLMQAGFTMVETGFTRAKNSGNLIMKNLLNFAIGSVAFCIIGFGIMFGAGGNALIGGFDFFIQGDYGVAGSYNSYAYIIFQTVFCATAATIVSGAMAERTKFLSYCIYSLVISAVVYPVSGHWIWGGGWLAQLGFHDFAGSTAVHLVGGIAALVGAKILGPRIGKYDRNGKSHAISGHSITLGALGVFILWFCWFGFNGGSTLSMTGEAAVTASKIFVTTNLAAACSTIAVMIITWVRYKKPDVSMTLNGTLAGLVAITAGCDQVSPAGAALIGILAAFVVVFGIEFIDKVLKIYDPVGAVGVHALNGAFGTLCVGLFATDGGLLYGGGFKLFGIQLLGIVSVTIWVAVSMYFVFSIIKKTVGLRVSKQEEVAGLDIEEHGIESSYADFMPSINTSVGSVATNLVSGAFEDGTIPVKDTVTVEHLSVPEIGSDLKSTMISILCKQSKFEELKFALNAIDITGITVTQVLGCGTQKGNTEFYRGVPVDINLLPKIKVDVVVSKIPVRAIIETAKKALYTGHIGDGKIFVYDVENIVRVRTGEEGYDALQDSE